MKKSLFNPFSAFSRYTCFKSIRSTVYSYFRVVEPEIAQRNPPNSIHDVFHLTASARQNAPQLPPLPFPPPPPPPPIRLNTPSPSPRPGPVLNFYVLTRT